MGKADKQVEKWRARHTVMNPLKNRKYATAGDRYIAMIGEQKMINDMMKRK